MPTAASRVAACVAIATFSACAGGATLYTDDAPFFGAVSVSLTDGYQNLEYQHPDNARGTFTDARMGAILGATKYTTTGLADRNIVEFQVGQGIYCAGCNGSFLLDFTATPVGDQDGVYAVGLNVIANQPNLPYVAFVTYGDNTTENIDLPVRNSQARPPSVPFWGISSGRKIRSIHFGGRDGAAVTGGGFAIDNLTIGAAFPADSDADGVADSYDNCVNVANGPLLPENGGPGQLDSDGDGYGNACDPDLNNSGMVTAADLNLIRSCLNELSTVSALCAAADLNGSGRVTSMDYNMLRDRINQPPGPSGWVP